MGRMKKARANSWWAKKNAEQGKQQPATVGGREDLEDMEDDIDKFHKNRDKLPLEATDSEDEGFENPVFDLKAAQSSSSEQEDEGSEDEMEEDELDDLAAKIAKQAKLMRQKTGILDEDEEEDDEPEKERKDWGKKKNFYYSADNVDFEGQSSDEEGPALEEAEARRLQKEGAARLRPEDFGQEVDVSEDEEEPDTIGKRVERGDQKTEDSQRISIEAVKKDLNALSKSERMQVVMSNAPELVGLLNELKEALHELDYKVQPLLKKVENGVIATKEGKNYVQLKHMLLLSYCQSIVFYLLLKAEGRSVLDHPVVARLVEIRLLLEKIRPVDEKLQYQVEKIMKLDYIPVKKNGVQEIIEVSDKLVGGTQMGKPTTVWTEKPKEIAIAEDSRKMLQELERLESKHKSLSRRGNETGAGKRSFQHLDYDEADVEEPEQQRKKITQVIAEAGKRQKKQKIVSGDVDLPVKEDIGERRRKQQQIYDEHEPDPDPDDDAGQLKTSKHNGKPEKAQQVKVTKEPDALRVQAAEAALEGKRRITYAMEKNRGLTPHRNKASKNPRKKYKTKHGKAVIRRKGMVRDIRKQTGPYEGEATGIRADISRSVRFKG